MFGRPRCREWTPLATQQLRLRSLIQIVGYNIRPPECCHSQCSFYYTLHHTTMSAPFYTSERISSPHPKWKEIDSEITQRMSSTNVVVRIWSHILQTTPMTEPLGNIPDFVIQTWGVYFSGLRFIGANLSLNFTSDSFKSNALVLQMQGGYFCSYKSLKLEVIPPENELEYGSLSSESSGKTNVSNKAHVEPKFIHNNRSIDKHSPSRFSRKTDKEYSKSHSPIERGYKQHCPSMKTSTSLNINQSSNSYRRRDDSNERRSNTNEIQIFEHSPDNLDVKEFTTSEMNCDNASKDASGEKPYGSKIDLSETAENYDLRNESDGAVKYRYLALNFLKSEIRPSYNSTKLQKLHLLQYSIKKRQDAVQEIKERIYHKSALTSTDDFLKYDDRKLKVHCRSLKSLFSNEEDSGLNKDLSSSETARNGKIKTEDRPIVSNGPRLALKLNDLLSFKSKPSPLQRAEHVRLTKQLEILRFKKIILSDERDAKLANIRRLKERHSKLSEENQDLDKLSNRCVTGLRDAILSSPIVKCNNTKPTITVLELISGSELMQGFHALSKRTEALKETKLSAGALREIAVRAHASLAAKRLEFLADLNNIFYIEQRDAATWTICGVPLPICSEMGGWGGPGLSAGAALATQALCVASFALHQPLRYAVSLRGERTTLRDEASQLPDPNIPLYARGTDTTLFRYGMFLLNKCVAQLMWARGLPITDMRPTLANLKRLMTSHTAMMDSSKLFGMYKWLEESQCPRTQSLRSLVASDRGKYRQFNRFKDCVDGQTPHTVMTLQRHRHSRSVGSYQDDQDLAGYDTSTASIMGSEPSLYDAKLIAGPSNMQSKTLKLHRSDSEISRHSSEQTNNHTDSRVVFTLGDYETLRLEDQNLVRFSSNNGDDISLDDNVKQICTEIEDFCSTNNISVEEMNLERTERDDDNIHEAFEAVENVEAINLSLRVACVEKHKDVHRCCDSTDNVDVPCANIIVSDTAIQISDDIRDTGQSVALNPCNHEVEDNT